MIRQLMRFRRKRILIDVNTQKDLLYSDGLCCVGNNRRVLANIRRVMALVRRKHIPVISTTFVQPAGSVEGYCVDGTVGQQKIGYTVLDSHADFAADSSGALPGDLLRHYQQIILNDRTIDPFEEPRIDRLLSELRIGEFIVIGASCEDSVLEMVLGLLQRGKEVTVISDAVGGHDKARAKMAMRKMAAKGAHLVETRKFAGISHLASSSHKSLGDSGALYDYIVEAMVQ